MASHSITGLPWRRAGAQDRRMRTIGLVGGMSWYSTAEYYRVINSRVQERLGGHASAPLVLVSLDFAEIRACQVSGDWERAAELLTDAARRCEQAGAESVLICTNLMHRVAEAVRSEERRVGKEGRTRG